MLFNAIGWIFSVLKILLTGPNSSKPWIIERLREFNQIVAQWKNLMRRYPSAYCPHASSLPHWTWCRLQADWRKGSKTIIKRIFRNNKWDEILIKCITRWYTCEFKLTVWTKISINFMPLQYWLKKHFNGSIIRLWPHKIGE